MDITREARRTYIVRAGIECPHCGSPDLSHGRIVVEYGAINQWVSCQGCGEVWYDLYKLAGAVPEGGDAPIPDPCVGFDPFNPYGIEADGNALPDDPPAPWTRQMAQHIAGVLRAMATDAGRIRINTVADYLRLGEAIRCSMTYQPILADQAKGHGVLPDACPICGIPSYVHREGDPGEHENFRFYICGGNYYWPGPDHRLTHWTGFCRSQIWAHQLTSDPVAISAERGEK